MAAGDYSAVPSSDTVVVVSTEQAEPDLAPRIRASSRVVAAFCAVQLVLAGIGLLAGNFIGFFITALFVSLGVTGVVKRNHRLVISHFVYSVVVYVLSLVGIVMLVLYYDATWLDYLVAALFIIVQAVGLKHERMLIWALRRNAGVTGGCCGSSRVCQRETTIVPESVAVAPAPAPAPAPTVAQAPAAAAAPAPVMYSMPMINGQSRTIVQSSPIGTQSSSVSMSSGPAPTAPVMQSMMYPQLPQMQQFPQFQQYAQFQGVPMQPYSPYGPNSFPMVPMTSQQYVAATQTQSPRVAHPTVFRQ